MLDQARKLQLRLTGDRFVNGQMPLEFLRDLAALGEAMREAAKESYLTRNPERKRIPNGFAENVSPIIESIEPGSTLVTVGFPVHPQRPMLIDQPTYMDDAWDKIITELSDHEGENQRSVTPETGSQAWKTKLRRFGANLRDGESAVLVGSNGREVKYDRGARRQYMRTHFPNQRYAEHASFTGRIHAVNTETRTFEITLSDGTVVIAETPEEYRAEVREAWTAHDQGSTLEVSVQGEVEYNTQEQPAAVKQITEITLLHPLDIDRQIDRLTRLETGWLDGDGESLSNEGLLWLRDALQSQISFGDSTMPHLYPTEEGGVQAEWSLGSVSADLNIDLSSHRAIWDWSDLSTNEHGERELNLDLETDWQWLEETLTAITFGSTI